jgi:hypothetical protein
MRSSHRGRRAELNCRTFLCLISASLLTMGAILFLNSLRRSSDPSLQRHGKEVLHSMYNGSNNFDDLVLWSSDFHISPIADIKNVMESYRVKVIDKSLSGHCHLSGTCQHDLRVINKDNGISLGSCPNKLIEEFYKSYKSDSEMQSVSAFLCTHAASLCELFMPFDRPMIIIASTR